MKFNLKNVFISVGILVSAFVFIGAFSTNKAEAATCTAATGNWNTTGTWVADCGHVPTSSDDVVIPTGVTVTVDTAAVANTVTINAAGTANGITISGSNSLTVTGAITMNAPSAAVNSTIAVGAGSLSAAGITIPGSATSSRNAILSVSTGSITSSSGITFSGTAAQAQLTATGAATITLSGTTGTIGAGGTVALNSASNVVYTGTGAQTINSYAYGNLNINKASGTATLDPAGTFYCNNLVITSGVLDASSSVFTVNGTTNLTSGGTFTFSSATGLKTFTGDVTINGTWNETAAVAVTFAGNVTDNATGTTSTGVHTFSGSSKTLTSSVPINIASVSVSGTVAGYGSITVPTLLTIGGTFTNNGTVTATTSLAGAGTFVNATGGTLNIGGTSTVATLTTATSSNTVNYTAGAQTVLPTVYNNLTLSHTGLYTVTGVSTNGIFTVQMGGNNYLVTNGSTATSINVGGSTVAVLVPSGTFTLGSPSGFTLGATDGVVTAPQSCVAASNTVVITGTGSTFTITPNTTSVVCANGSGGGQLTNGSTTTTASASTISTGTTSSSTSTSTTTNTTSTSTTTTSTPSTSTDNTIAQTLNKVIPGCNGALGFSTVTGESCALNTTVPVVTGNTSVTYNFGTKTLKLGSTGAGVKELQKFLNANLGLNLKVDGKLGAKTIAIVKKWQKDHGLKADGVIGKTTKSEMNAVAQ